MFGHSHIIMGSQERIGLPSSCPEYSSVQLASAFAATGHDAPVVIFALGSNGGTEIIGRFFSKYHPETDISRVVLVSNFIITVCGSIVVMAVENQHFDIVLYSLMYVVIGGNVLGMLKRGFNHPQKFLIVTSKYEKIGADISRYFKRGYTLFDVANSYDGVERKMIVVVVQYRQLHFLKHIIRRRDPNAFTVIKDVYDVFSRPTFNRSYKTK